MVAPGISYTAIWLNDVMALTGAAYRVSQGQVPSIDFLSPYGMAVHYPAALGFRLGLDPSVVLPFGQATVAAFLLMVAVVVAYRRIGLIEAVIFIVLTGLLLLVPVRMGGPPADLSFGCYYNRHGWAGLAIVLLYFVEPRTTSRRFAMADAVALSFVLLFLIYNKINFAAIALAFVVATTLLSAYMRGLAMACVVIVGVTLLAVELTTGYNSAYIARHSLHRGAH